jgi:hypothetical protein
VLSQAGSSQASAEESGAGSSSSAQPQLEITKLEVRPILIEEKDGKLHFRFDTKLTYVNSTDDNAWIDGRISTPVTTLDTVQLNVGRSVAPATDGTAPSYWLNPGDRISFVFTIKTGSATGNTQSWSWVAERPGSSPEPGLEIITLGVAPVLLGEREGRLTYRFDIVLVYRNKTEDNAWISGRVYTPVTTFDTQDLNVGRSVGANSQNTQWTYDLPPGSSVRFVYTIKTAKQTGNSKSWSWVVGTGLPSSSPSPSPSPSLSPSPEPSSSDSESASPSLSSSPSASPSWSSSKGSSSSSSSSLEPSSSSSSSSSIPSSSSSSSSSPRRKTQNFRLRLFSGGEVTYAVYGGGVFTVQIQEMFPEGPGRKKYYTFLGGGPAIGFKHIKIISALKSGINILSDWKEFTLPVPATVDDFEGGGCIAQAPGVSLVVISASFGMWFKFYNPCWYEVYLNTSGVGPTSGFGATILSYYQGYWKGI